MAMVNVDGSSQQVDSQFYLSDELSQWSTMMTAL